jgi:hypothetical protein
MTKNLFTTEAVNQMIGRINKLQPDTQSLWGKMNATEMLLHCNSIHERLLTQPATPGKKTTLKQLLIRTVVLYVMPHYPKNVTAPKPLQVSGKIPVTEYENQKEKCIQLLHQFLQHNQEVNHYHPYFGNLNTKQWGRTSWKHLDHHLRQFGV